MKLRPATQTFHQKIEAERIRQIEAADRENHKRGRDVEIGTARLILTNDNGVRWNLFVDETGSVQTIQIGDEVVADWTKDAFGRSRVASTGQRLDVEFIYNKQPAFFDEITNNGTITHNANSRDLTLSISDAANGTYATMRSHPVPYTPGNSQIIDITGTLDLAAIGGGTAQVFLRSSISGSVTETVVDQSSWQDATSGVDWTDSHIFTIDFQSLKVGRIRYGLVQNGSVTQVHEIFNDNARNTGYWQLASLPVYWRVYNDATYTYMECGYGDESNAVGFRYRIAANASATMRAICCTVKSEGGTDLGDFEGLPRSTDMGVTAKTVSTTLIPLLSIRPRSTFNSLTSLGVALPKSVSVQTDNPIRLVVVVGGTLTGAAWVNVDTNNSIMEADVTATAITGGTTIASEYFATSKNIDASGQGFLGKSVLWSRLSSETGILTLAAVRSGSTNASVLASVSWDEIV